MIELFMLELRCLRLCVLLDPLAYVNMVFSYIPWCVLSVIP